MDESGPNPKVNQMARTADIVSAFVSNNSVPMSELAYLLSSVHAALSGLATGGPAAKSKDEVEKRSPAQIKQSITRDSLISFEDGKPYKTLKRHLTVRGLTPEAYRTKHGLPTDYPMISASYSAKRSELARLIRGQSSFTGQTNDATHAAESGQTASEAAPGMIRPH